MNGKEKDSQNTDKEKINNAMDYLSKLGKKKAKKLIELLKQVEKVQKSDISLSDKSNEIKKILWTRQSAISKLWIGGFIGTLVGFMIFGTGGLGLAGLGSAVGVWGFLAGTTGGVLISSLIQNFENKKNK